MPIIKLTFTTLVASNPISEKNANCIKQNTLYKSA